MRKAFLAVVIVAILGSVTGCNRGPFRQFFRGAPCNTCQPPVGRMWGWGQNTLGRCADGVCDSNGAYDGESVGTAVDETGYYQAPAGSANPANLNGNVAPANTGSAYDPYTQNPQSGGSLGGIIQPPATSNLPRPGNRN